MRHRSLLAVCTFLVGAVALTGCSGAKPLAERFGDVPTTPGAASYEGALESELDSQIVAIVSSSGDALGGSRIEYLPAGETWESHLAWRADHVDGRELQPVGATDPDPRRATFVGDEDIVVVLGREADDGRLVVMTALLGS